MLCDEELNYCETNENVCLNGGKCTSQTEDEGSFKCECPSGFRGKNCEIFPPQIYLMGMNVSSTTMGSRPSKPTLTSNTIPHITPPSLEGFDEDIDGSTTFSSIIANKTSNEDETYNEA